eukprot:c44887_g1_i1 orf=3-317(-)
MNQTSTPPKKRRQKQRFEETTQLHRQFKIPKPRLSMQGSKYWATCSNLSGHQSQYCKLPELNQRKMYLLCNCPDGSKRTETSEHLLCNCPNGSNRTESSEAVAFG